MQCCIQKMAQPSSDEQRHCSCQTCLYDDRDCYTSYNDMKSDLGRKCALSQFILRHEEGS